ncbi:MAG: group 1 truncated hemoglobin [Kofleriaceae bacterium]
MRLSAVLLAVSLATAAACGGTSTPAPAAPAAEPAAASLYDRLGQQPAIEIVIDKFLANIVADARINAFFAGLDGAAVARVRTNLIDQVCAATGGPCEYKGKSMKETHTGMNLTDAHFDAIVEDLVHALDDAGVGQTEKDELLGALGGMRADIVGH